MAFEPAAPNPLAALTAWVARLQACSEASCLPARDVLRGEFLRFESLEAYERDVLSAVRSDEG